MAELALAGTIIGLVATGAHLAVKVANFVEALDGAPESLTTLSSELRNINGILSELQDPVKPQSSSLPSKLSNRINEVVKTCTSTFSQLNALISKLGRPGSKRQKWLFVFYADNIESARSSLETSKTSLTLVLQLVLR
jgi:hypothetical protein